MDDNLDDLLARARAGAMQPSEALMARVLADAARMQPAAAKMAPAVVAPPPGFWAGLAGFFGGGAALAGMGSAAVAGLFLGFVQPAALMGIAAGLTGAEALDSLDLMPGVDALWSGE